MKFPVDLLADVSLAELEQSARNYMNNLLHSNPDSPEHLTISASTKVTIDISSVGFIPLYGSNDTWKILALFSPSDPFIAVGLYLLDRWWAVEDILKTADPVRDGAVEVDTVGERIVLYILNRVIYRGKEMTSEDLPFLCHGEKDYAKIVWNNGEAVGFYSVKPSGSICNSFSVRTYQLPVMDSIFVRKCQRRKGFGLQMLVDFVLSFKEESLGLRYPLTKSMYKVCEKYLCQYPGDTDLLWEVESVGGPNQRTNIAKKIMAIDINVSKSLSFSEESLLTPDVAERVLKETITVECSAETMVQEEVTVLRATKEIDDVPVVGQSRSSGLKRRKIGEKITEDKSEKVIRIEDIEAETPSKDQVSVQRKTALHDSYELEQTEVLLSVTKEKAEDVVDTPPEGEPTIELYKPATALMSKDLAEADVTSAIMTEEQHIQDGATQDHNESHDSQITVENVASETQEAEVYEKEGGADIPFGGDAEENILPMEFDKEISWKNEETSANDDKVQGIYVEETKVIETRVLRSGEQTVRATTTMKTTKRQDGEEEEEADGLKSNGDKPAEERAVREGRRSAATARQQSKQAQEETIITEEIQVDETKAVLEESEERKESREKAEAVAGVSPTEQETVEKEPSTVSVTCVDREDMASIWECAKGTPDERKVPSEEEAVTVETTILRSSLGTVRATLQSETTVRQDNDEQEQDTTKEKSTKEDASVFRKRMLRKAMSAGVHQTEEEEEEEEESTPAKEIYIAETKDNINDEIEEKDGEEDACQKDDTEDTLNTNVEKVSDEIKAPAVETRLLRSGGKLVKTIPVDQKKEDKNDEEAAVQKDENLESEVEIKKVEAVAGVSLAKQETVEKEQSTVSVHEETAATEEADPVEKIAVEGEEEQSEETMKQENTIPEEHIYSSSVEIEKTEIEKGVVEEEGLEEKVENVVTKRDTGEGSAEETAGENNAKSDDENNSKVNESGTLRGRKQQVTNPARHESVRVLRSGRKSVPVTQTRTRKSIHKQIQKEESEGGEESAAVEVTDPEEEEEQAETPSMIDQEKGEALENDATQQEENTAPEMDIENMNTVAEEAVTQDVPEVGQADSAETIIDEDVEALVGKADEGMTSDEFRKEAVTGPETVEGELATSEVEETAAGESSDNKLQTANDDHEEETPVIETRVLRSGTQKVTATTHKATQSRKKADEQDAKHTELEKPAVTAITLRRGRISAHAQPKDESRRIHKQVQEKGQRGEEEPEGVETTGIGDEQNTIKEPIVEKTDEEIEGKNQKEMEKHEVEAASEKVEYLELSVGVEEGKAVAEGQATTEEGTIPVTETENIDEVTAGAAVLVQEGETDTPLLKSATDSAALLLSEEEAVPSSKKQQSEEIASQIFGLQKLTVVLVDMKKSLSEVHEEAVATAEADPVEKIAVEGEEEQSEETMKQENTIPEEHIYSSSVEIEKTEIEKGVVEEEGLEEKVENVVTKRDTGEGSAEETAGENNAKSDDENNSKVNESGTLRGRKQQVTNPARHESVRVLRSGRKSVPVTQTRTRKSIHKQIQKEESEGEESAAVEVTDPEEEEEQAETPSMIDQEKGEALENDATQQEENTAPEMDIENMNTVAEEAVTQDVPEVGQADSAETIIDEDVEALVGKADEGMTSDEFRKEAVTGPETVEGELATSEVEETAAGESSDNKLQTANDDHEEETPVIETRVLRSGTQKVTATTRIKTTKRQDGEEEEEADGLKSNGDKPAEERAVREGRRSAATARQQSKQAQEETIITEEIQVDETKAVLEESEERKESRKKAEAVAGVSPTEQETVEKEPSTVSVTCVDREDMASIWECAKGTPDERKVPSEEEAVTVETTILRSSLGTVRATLQSETTVRQDNDEQEQDTTKEKSTKEDESVFRKRMLRKAMSAGVHQTEEEEEEEEESTPAKEIYIAETKDNINDEIEEKDGEEDACQKDDTEDTLNTNVEKVSDEIKAPAVETRLLRSGGKLVKTIPVTKATKSHHEQNTLVGMLGEKSADTEKLAVETRMLRKGRRSAPATPREKSKRRRTQCQPEKQSQKTATAQEMEGEEDEVGQESPEKEREKAEEERKRMGMEAEHSNDAEQGEAESAPGAESVVGDTEQMQDSLIEETAVVEGDRGDSSKTDLVETDIIQISSAEVEETNSTEEEGITEIKKSTAVTVVLPDTSTAEEEALVKGASVMAEEAAPTATRISLSTKTKTSHAKLTRSSRSQKDQEQVKTNIQQLEEESLGDVATQEVHPLTDNPPEKRKLKDEQSEAEETSSGHGADEDILEYINMETADSRSVDSVGEETQSVTDKEEDEKVESNEDKDNMTYDFSDSQQIKKLEESSKEENLENAVKAGEKGNILNPTLETDEEEETLGSSQKQEKDEQNMSEDEVEPIVIGKRFLRWRTVPSVIITPRSKSRRHSTKVPKAEESSSDEEKSPQSSKRRRSHKRKSTEVTLTPKFKRPSRVQEVLHTTIKCKK